jgi:hypothetical protein
MALGDIAARLSAAGAELTAVAAALPGHELDAGAFGAVTAGRLGALGRRLHRDYAVALDARGREAAGHGARLSTLADAVNRAASGYAAADDAAGVRHREIL